MFALEALAVAGCAWAWGAEDVAILVLTAFDAMWRTAKMTSPRACNVVRSRG